MKIAIMADTHFGYPRFYKDSMRQGAEAFNKACELADIIIIAGDIFDTKVPKMEVLGEVMEILEAGKKKKWIAKNERGTIPVVAIHGTHERRAKESTNPIQILERSGFITNVHDGCDIFEKEGDNEKIAIYGLGGVPDEYIHRAIEESNIKPEKDAFNIFVFHQTISDFVPAAKGIEMNNLPEGFDLYVCGHLHKKRIENKNGKLLIIPGSTVITQLRGDETEPKGFFIFDTKTKKAEFLPIKSRPFIFKEIKFKEANNQKIKESCRTAINEILKQKFEMKPIIKLQLIGEVKEGLKRENIDLNDLIDEYSEKTILEIENSLNAVGLAEKIELFRKLYEEKKSVREAGIDILKEKVGKEIPNAEEIFEELSDDKRIDEFIEKHVKKKVKESVEAEN